MKRILLLAIATIALLAGCSPAPSNIHALSTDDCGVNWKKIPTGTSVPKHVGVCGYNLAIPNWPMAGEADFKTQFQGKVLTRARLSYTYIVTDPILFIKNASYLGKMGGSLDISADDAGKKYEMAENIIIDKTLREVTITETNKLEIVDANPAEVEDAISAKITPILAGKGITISDIALVIEPDAQTRLAIDVATAIRVYENAGMADVGKQVAIAHAGASHVTTHITPKAEN